MADTPPSPSGGWGGRGGVRPRGRPPAQGGRTWLLAGEGRSGEERGRPMKLSLIVLTSGKQEGKAIEIKGPEFLVGRDPECQLRPASPLISKRHCAIVLGDGKAVVRDFGSTNGTFLNDQPVKGEAELHNDDQLKIGPLHFRVRIEAPAAKPKPAPAP